MNPRTVESKTLTAAAVLGAVMLPFVPLFGVVMLVFAIGCAMWICDREHQDLQIAQRTHLMELQRKYERGEI
jgi:type IV secretory pathway TrbD component